MVGLLNMVAQVSASPCAERIRFLLGMSLLMGVEGCAGQRGGELAANRRLVGRARGQWGGIESKAIAIHGSELPTGMPLF